VDGYWSIGHKIEDVEPGLARFKSLRLNHNLNH